MNQIQSSFDYQKLDSSTVSFLKTKESNMQEIVGKAYTELGRELKEAQDELSKRGYGCFYEWFESLGLKKDQVYRWIGRYDLIVSNCDKRNLIEDLPLTLSYEIAKPSADPELKEAVLNGDITTHKQYKELERSKADAERRAKQAEEESKRIQNEKIYYEKLWQQEKNKQPQTITNTVEVVPDKVKKQISELENQNNDLRHGYQSAKEKLKSYELRQADDFDAEEAQRQRDKLQHEADINTINVRIAYKNFVEKASITSFLHGAIATASASEKERLEELVEAAEQIINQTKLALRGRKLGVVNE